MAPRKKLKPETKTTAVCDYCSKALGRTCARTDMSSICAAGEGIIVKKHFGEKNGEHCYFFCSDACARTFDIRNGNSR